MLNRVIEFSVNNRLFVIGLSLLISIIGIYSAVRSPIDVLPDLNRPVVTIFSEAHGFAPADVETRITFPIESVVNGATGVHRVRSASMQGLSMVWVDFDWDSDPYRARQIITEKLQQITSVLPEQIKPVLGPISSIMGEIMLIGITSESAQVDPMELRSAADWIIKPRLQSIPGIAQITVTGGAVRQYQVLADPNLLIQHGVSISQLEEAVAQSNQNSSGGYILESHKESQVQVIGRLQGVSDLEETFVTLPQEGHADSPPILVKNLAQVKLAGPPVKRGDAGVSGLPAVMLVVKKQPGADTLKLTKHIKQELNSLKEALPSGVKVHPDIFKQSDFIETAIGEVKNVLRDGFLLVSLVLFFFLLNIRTTVITLTAIPLSMIVSFIVFKALGLSVNTMTLGGLAIAIGELVDDAIVDVENIFRRLRENQQLSNPEPVHKVVYQASTEIRGSIVFATLTVILVFIPLFAMGDIEGRLFQPIGIAYVTSILASLLVALTITPVMCYYLLPSLKQMTDTKDGFLVSKLKALHASALNYVFKFGQIFVLVTFCGFLMSVWIATSFGREFLPPFNEGSVTISLMMAPGTSLEESNRIGRIAENLLLKIDEVSSTGRRVGRAEQDEHAQGVHSSEIDFKIDRSDRHRDEILAEIRSTLSQIPGVFVNVGQPISHRIDHLMSGVRAQIAIKIFGSDLVKLRELAKQVQKLASQVPGLVDLQTETQVLVPQIAIKIKRVEAARYGLNIEHVSEAIETALKGKVVSQIIKDQKTFDIVLRLKDSQRYDLNELRSLPIQVEGDHYLPLSAVANINLAKGPNVIVRENTSRRIVVFGNVAGRDLVTAVEDLQLKLSELPLPTGYFIQYGGQFESQVSASKLIYRLAVFALLAVFSLLYLHFGKINLVLQVMLSIPFAFIGAIFAVAVSGGVFSIASLVGLITLTGIATRNAIMMIDHYLHLMREEGEKFDLKMIYRGSSERLVPVLMTALTAMLALVPILVGAGEPGKEILFPVAVVIFGGLFSSTFLNLLITPLIFWKLSGSLSERINPR